MKQDKRQFSAPHMARYLPSSMGGRYVMSAALLLTAAGGSAFAEADYKSASRPADQALIQQPLPPMPLELAPRIANESERSIPDTALRHYGIDPIITGPVPKKSRA